MSSRQATENINPVVPLCQGPLPPLHAQFQGEIVSVANAAETNTHGVQMSADGAQLQDALSDGADTNAFTEEMGAGSQTLNDVFYKATGKKPDDILSEDELALLETTKDVWRAFVALLFNKFAPQAKPGPNGKVSPRAQREAKDRLQNVVAKMYKERIDPKTAKLSTAVQSEDWKQIKEHVVKFAKRILATEDVDVMKKVHDFMPPKLHYGDDDYFNLGVHVLDLAQERLNTNIKKAVPKDGGFELYWVGHHIQVRVQLNTVSQDEAYVAFMREWGLEEGGLQELMKPFKLMLAYKYGKNAFSDAEHVALEFLTQVLDEEDAHLAETPLALALCEALCKLVQPLLAMYDFFEVGMPVVTRVWEKDENGDEVEVERVSYQDVGKVRNACMTECYASFCLLLRHKLFMAAARDMINKIQRSSVQNVVANTPKEALKEAMDFFVYNNDSTGTLAANAKHEDVKSIERKMRSEETGGDPNSKGLATKITAGVAAGLTFYEALQAFAQKLAQSSNDEYVSFFMAEFEIEEDKLLDIADLLNAPAAMDCMRRALQTYAKGTTTKLVGLSDEECVLVTAAYQYFGSHVQKPEEFGPTLLYRTFRQAQVDNGLIDFKEPETPLEMYMFRQARKDDKAAVTQNKKHRNAGGKDPAPEMMEEDEEADSEDEPLSRSKGAKKGGRFQPTYKMSVSRGRKGRGQTFGEMLRGKASKRKLTLSSILAHSSASKAPKRKAGESSAGSSRTTALPMAIPAEEEEDLNKVLDAECEAEDAQRRDELNAQAAAQELAKQVARKEYLKLTLEEVRATLKERMLGRGMSAFRENRLAEKAAKKAAEKAAEKAAMAEEDSDDVVMMTAEEYEKDRLKRVQASIVVVKVEKPDEPLAPVDQEKLVASALQEIARLQDEAAAKALLNMAGGKGM